MGFKVRFVRQTALAGHIWPVIEKFIITSEEVEDIVENIRDVGEWVDMLIIIAIGWCFLPLVQYICDLVYILLGSKETFRDTRLFTVVFHIARVAQLALLVYLVDIIDVVMVTLGFKYSSWINLPDTFAKVTFTLWIASGFRIFKHYLLVTYIGEKRHKDGLALLLDHLVDAIIGGFTLFTLIDIFDLEGLGLTSICAFGSAGTLAFTLASQAIVSNAVNGFALTTSNRFYVGDNVRFGDGTSGTIQTLGWLETTLRGGDDLVITVPNTQLADQRVANLSRNKKCQVVQKLHFKYEDIDKLDGLLVSIKKEIKKSCPELIYDGSRPFRVLWTDYNDNYLKVLVDTHFNLKPLGDEYWNNRQEVLKAINRAVKTHNLEFALN